MTLLTIAAALLLAATIWLLSRPLARPVKAADSEEYHQLHQVRARLLAQLNELDAEAAGMDATVVRDERTRLEAELAQVLHRLDTLQPDAPAAAAAPVTAGQRRRVVIALAVLVPLVAIGLYAGKQGRTLEQLSLMGPGGQPDPLKMVARLEKRLEQQPDDATGWARLGRAYAVLGKPEQATAAYARAYKLSPDDSQVLAEYAGFLFNQDTRNTEGLVHALFSRLFELDPKNPDALWFFGYAAHQKGDYAQAVGYWKQLLKQLPPESEEASHLKRIIAETQAKRAK